jgi:hypothetical protein
LFWNRIPQTSLRYFFLFLRHLSMDRLRRRRSSASLLFSVHHRVGHSVCFLFVFVAALADRQLTLHQALRQGIAMRALPNPRASLHQTLCGTMIL